MTAPGDAPGTADPFESPDGGSSAARWVRRLPAALAGSVAGLCGGLLLLYALVATAATGYAAALGQWPRQRNDRKVVPVLALAWLAGWGLTSSAFEWFGGRYAKASLRTLAGLAFTGLAYATLHFWAILP